jgi:hypothetical protein
VGGGVPVDSDALLLTDFVNLKIKLAQSFEGAHTDRVDVRAFIGVSDHTCMSICIYTVFLKKHTRLPNECHCRTLCPNLLFKPLNSG